APVPDYGRALGVKGTRVRLGVPRATFFDDLDPEIEKAVAAAIDVLRKLTGDVTEVQLPPSSSHRVIMGPEAYAYHSQWIAESPEKYQAQTRERLIELSSSVTKENYVQARRQCDLLRREIGRKVFTTIDLLVTPTMASPPSTI